MSRAAKRITKEYEMLSKDPIENLVFDMNPNNVFDWSSS